jgi:hypothetical protein
VLDPESPHRYDPYVIEDSGAASGGLAKYARAPNVEVRTFASVSEAELDMLIIERRSFAVMRTADCDD